MIAIPLPFIMSLLLVIIAITLFAKKPIEGKVPSLFITLCAISTAVVGLRWTFDIAIFRFLQPVFASFLPVMAWCCFSKTYNAGRLSWLHLSGPLVIIICSWWPELWLNAIDVILTTLYLSYGTLLIRSSFVMPDDVRLSHVERVLFAQRVAGITLLVSACIDGVLSFDFMVYGGEHALYILSLSYLILIPSVVVAVIIVGFSTLSTESEALSDVEEKSLLDASIEPPSKRVGLSEQDAKDIVSKIDTLMKDKEAFRDMNLTLGRLSRKVGIPTRQVSMAVNQVCGMNISKVLNEYRITYAKKRLVDSEDSITDIYLSAGFQTKSNFNREFTRITGQTPSTYRNDA
ncbi:helix-turn-helix domain-containing protein [Moritella sp. JT01]|uniref:helix-turn-helix domain-containing protein n=1 Tax=Moritella sp. JT01 TaxID=756698 RepID=UPI00082EBF57|nr:helix-turn-helix domain-containing protein [Moritella sp. JT01]